MTDEIHKTGNGKRSRATLDAILDGIGEVVLAEAVEQNLDTVQDDAMAIFMVNHKDEWNAFLKDTVIPALTKRAGLEAADLEAKVLAGVAGGALTDEERTVTVESIRSQKESLLNHAYDHMAIGDARVAKAKKRWDRWFSDEATGRFSNDPKA